MQLCYVDESGTAETLVKVDPNQQPVIVVAGVSLPEQDLTKITHEWNAPIASAVYAGSSSDDWNRHCDSN